MQASAPHREETNPRVPRSQVSLARRQQRCAETWIVQVFVVVFSSSFIHSSPPVLLKQKKRCGWYVQQKENIVLKTPGVSCLSCCFPERHHQDSKKICVQKERRRQKPPIQKPSMYAPSMLSLQPTRFHIPFPGSGSMLFYPRTQTDQKYKALAFSHSSFSITPLCIDGCPRPSIGRDCRSVTLWHFASSSTCTPLRRCRFAVWWYLLTRSRGAGSRGAGTRTSLDSSPCALTQDNVVAHGSGSSGSGVMSGSARASHMLPCSPTTPSSYRVLGRQVGVEQCPHFDMRVACFILVRSSFHFRPATDPSHCDITKDDHRSKGTIGQPVVEQRVPFTCS